MSKAFDSTARHCHNVSTQQAFATLKTSPIDWPLLKRVSRSFYLTLRFLPSPVRESIALAYLVARLSDTLADGAETEGEEDLLARREEIEGWLSNSPDRLEIEKVWSTIRQGQRFDQDRFSRPDATPLDEQELDLYAYWSPDVSESSGPGSVRRKFPASLHLIRQK